MADKDVVSQVYLADNEGFADIVNVMAFDGKRVIASEDLSELSETARTIFKVQKKDCATETSGFSKKGSMGFPKDVPDEIRQKNFKQMQ